MVRMLVVLFGVALIFLGVGSGIMPTLVENGLLFGYFSAGATHNLVYLTTGVVALISATSAHFSKVALMGLGIFYLLVGGVGIGKEGNVYFMHNSLFDNYLFIGIGIVLLLVGLSAKK